METRTNTSDEGVIQIRRNIRVAVVIGVFALIVAVMFLLRGGLLGDVVGLVLLMIAAGHLATAWDGRVPLVLVDEQGVRLRLGRTWRGLPWSQVDEIEHTPRPSGVRQLWHDGRLAVLPVDEDAEMAQLSGFARRWARLSERLYGVPFSVPLGLSTTVGGVQGDLTAALAALAGPTTGIVVIDESLEPQDGTGPIPVVRDQEKALPTAEETPKVEPTRDAEPTPGAEPIPDVEATSIALPRVTPLREITQPVRVDVSYDAQISPLSPEDTGTIPAIRDSEPLEERRDPIVDSGIVPAADPVIGPQLAAARNRIGLGIDQLAERTRIRPHVIESIEVDDFGPCGGDFYARGHLRTLARVLGLDAAPLLAEYDERYADAPVDPRAVFEAELASTGSARSLRRVNGGPNWSVLVAAVMVIVLIWSIARLVTAGDSTPNASPAISLQANGSSGTTNPYAKQTSPVAFSMTAAGGGAHVLVRNGSGKVIYNGDLAYGASKSFRVSQPVRVQSSDGSLRVSINGQPGVAMGKTGQSSQRTYPVN